MTKIFVANLPYDCSEQDFRKLIEGFGPIHYVTLPKDFEYLRGRGIGFATYVREEDYNRALASLNGMVFQGRILRAEPARSRTSIPEH